MAAPEYVPSSASRIARTYASPPRRPQSWLAERPGDLGAAEPSGPGLGSPGPDQGYALTLAPLLAGSLVLGEGEHVPDALAVATAVGLKRASSFGRAPILADLRIGAAVWGLAGSNPPAELVDVRTEMFDEVHHPHHYMRLRRVVDVTPSAFLHRSVDTIDADLADDPWAGLAGLDR